MWEDYIDDDGELSLSPFGCKWCKTLWEEVDHCEECGVCPCTCKENQ